MAVTFWTQVRRSGEVQTTLITGPDGGAQKRAVPGPRAIEHAEDEAARIDHPDGRDAQEGRQVREREEPRRHPLRTSGG